MLEKNSMKKNPTPEPKLERFLLVCGISLFIAVGNRIRNRSRDGSIMKTSQAEVSGKPQFDSGRWKLRLELVPLSAGKQATISTDFDSAAQASIDETASSTLVPVRNGVCGRHGFVKCRSSNT
jgi:hypothetical protein